MDLPSECASDGVDHVVLWNDERVSTIASWHPPEKLPEGRPFGASGVCITPAGKAVIVSPDGRRWSLPGGRPEGDETAVETLRREMTEEACVSIQQAWPLGFCQITDTGSVGAGVTKVRAWFRADVTVHPWVPQFEIAHRRLVDFEKILAQIVIAPGETPILNRVLYEAKRIRAGAPYEIW
jgi:8-oxo-dGTP pyrophosphatase MutT (NUDIX family)